MMLPPVLILAIGNESRGDDAIAPLLLRDLDSWLTNKGMSGQFELIEDFQLQIEHAADLEGRKLILFVDAGMDTPAPYSFYRARVSDERTAFSHAISPEAVLATYMQVFRQPPPPAFILCVRGDRFELGDPISPAASQNMKAAMGLMRDLAQNTDISCWQTLSTRS